VKLSSQEIGRRELKKMTGLLNKRLARKLKEANLKKMMMTYKI